MGTFNSDLHIEIENHNSYHTKVRTQDKLRRFLCQEKCQQKVLVDRDPRSISFRRILTDFGGTLRHMVFYFCKIAARTRAQLTQTSFIGSLEGVLWINGNMLSMSMDKNMIIFFKLASWNSISVAQYCCCCFIVV